MGAATIPAGAPSQNTLKDEQIEAFFQPRPKRTDRGAFPAPSRTSGVGWKDPASPSTEASSGQDATDLTRMMLSEIEAIAGHKRPISEYISERARPPKRGESKGKTRLSRRGNGKRTS